MSTIIKYGSNRAWLKYNGNVLNANATNTFYSAQSTEQGWLYIPDNSWR